jgi:hypothetical protein
MRASNFAALLLVAALLALAAPSASAADPAEEEKKPATFLDEVSLFAYLEQSFTFNLGGAGRGGVNELRVYDYDEDYTFNMAEFAMKGPLSATCWLRPSVRRGCAKRWASSATRTTLPFEHTAGDPQRRTCPSASWAWASSPGGKVEPGRLRGDRVAQQSELPPRLFFNFAP